MEEQGLYCGTAGAFFQDKESLVEHYKSEFHRYNLKRKVAGLPPVTREWYDARKSQLLGSLDTSVKRTWQDPLTGKKFGSENTYEAFTRSKKYRDLLSKLEGPAPSAIITIQRTGPAGADNAAASGPPAAPQRVLGHVSKPIGKPAPAATEEDEEGSVSDMSDDWETEDDASEAGEGAQQPEDWEEWNVCQSLFDGHVSASLEENLKYMYLNFGFYFPDTEFLVDPEGLMRYLGAKLQYGGVPLYKSGEDPEAKQFRSLHAVRRHMVDSGRCTMLYDGNEDEYADFYDYTGDDGEAVSAGVLALAGEDGAAAATGFELGVPLQSGGTRYLGTREFARYYKQRHRHDRRAALTAAARVLAQYRRMELPMLAFRAPEQVEKRRATKVQNKHWARERLSLGMARNINDKLPKNVPY
uniref:ZN622/Rei1/Reh1 zinc finger C2H2-type domain-containing protein n=1 Tax=Auxenochlorella protothecoides TaxID=3075 RepID=A0A1D2AEN6_AUXPR